MNLINLNAGQPLTMSSREISELCEKQHQHVKRDTENMLVELEIDASSFGRIYLDSMNRKQTEYFLPKDLTLTLVAGYSVKLRKRIIDRWLELEEKASQPRELSRLELLQLAIDSEQGRLEAEQKATQLESKVIELAPKAAAHDMLAVSDGDLCITDAAKALSVAPRKFTSYLIHIGWAYRRQSNGKLVGHATSEKRGLMAHRPVPIHHSSGEIETVLQPLITPKGLAKLAEMLSAGESA